MQLAMNLALNGVSVKVSVADVVPVPLLTCQASIVLL